MAVFTAIATAIVGAIGVTGIAATIATSIIAGGLAFGTAKVLGVFKPPQMESQKDPGVKIQLPPATDNKVPVFYGRNVTGGIIVDAEIKNQNNTMVYCLCISEKTDSGTYSINKIYRDDTTLTINSSGTVTAALDPNATTSDKVNGKMRVRVFAGNAQSSVNQIFPTTNKVAAQTLMTNIDTTTSFDGLVYAIFEIDYDPENGLTGLGAINFDISNSLSEPSNVLLDYLQNDRYGAGLSNTDLDTNSFNDLHDYATANVDVINTSNVTVQQERWRVDGMLSTYVNVKDNIDTLCQTCSTFFTYNPKVGKFAVVPNRAATTAEKANAYVLNDDNLIGTISITSTDLYGLYNKMEVEYPSLEKRDQTDTVFISTPPADRNTNEPDNKLTTRYALVNDSPRVHNLANIDLRQSRKSQVLEVEADYEAITVDAGDIVKITNTEYGFSNKLYRCMRVTESETNEGMLSAKLVLLEYDDSVYEHNTIAADGAVNVSGIPGWWTGIWGNIDYSNIANVVTGNITIVDDPTSGLANIANTAGSVTGNVGLGNTNVVYPPYTPPGTPVVNLPITIPDIPDIEKICTNLANMNVKGIDLPGHFCFEHVPANNANKFNPGDTVTLPIALPEPPVIDPTIPTLPITSEYNVDIDIGFLGFDGEQSAYVTVPNLPITYRGGASRNSQGPVQAGLQEEQTQSNTNVANAATAANADVFTFSPTALVASNVVVELGGIDEGEFSSVNTMLPGGEFFTDEIYTQAFMSRRDIAYKEIDIDPSTGKHTANANADIVDIVTSGGQQIGSVGSIPSALTESFEYNITSARGSALASAAGRPAASSTKLYLANTMTISHYANSDLISNASGGAPRQIRVTNADKRIGKGDDYLPIIPVGSIGP